MIFCANILIHEFWFTILHSFSFDLLVEWNLTYVMTKPRLRFLRHCQSLDREYSGCVVGFYALFDSFFLLKWSNIESGLYIFVIAEFLGSISFSSVNFPGPNLSPSHVNSQYYLPACCTMHECIWLLSFLKLNWQFPNKVFSKIGVGVQICWFMLDDHYWYGIFLLIGQNCRWWIIQWKTFFHWKMVFVHGIFVRPFLSICSSISLGKISPESLWCCSFCEIVLYTVLSCYNWMRRRGKMFCSC